MKSRLSCLLFFFLAIKAFSSQNGSDAQETSRLVEVRSVVDLYMEAFEKGDSALLDSLMADDEIMITFGTDAAERWVGKRELMLSFEKQISAFDVESIDISDQVIRLSQSGTTAWFSEIADWNIRVGSDLSAIRGIRITGVLERQADQWKIVQFHTSAPVAGQIVEY